MGGKMRYTARRAIAVCCIAVAVLFVGLFAYNTLTMGAWASDDLGPGRHWCDLTYYTEIMIDSDGNPHVIYTGEGIVHARNTGDGWETTEIPTFNSAYFDSTCCALMDEDDAIHVFVSHEATVEDLSDSRVLVHITNAGGTWTESYIDGLPGIDYYSTLSCVAMPGGGFHVLSSGATRSTEPGDLQNLRLVDWHFDGAVWNVTSVLSLPEEWDGVDVTDLKVDESGNLHAVGTPWWDYTLGGLMYASSEDGDWSMELLPWTPDVRPARLALRDGAPFVGLSVDGLVMVVHEQGGTWTEFVDLQTMNELGSPFDIEFAGDGTLHVVYGAYGDVPYLDVWHAAVKDGVTTSEKVHDSLYWHSFPSIAVDDGGDVHMAFSVSHMATYATDGIDSLVVRAAGSALRTTLIVAGVCLVVGTVSAATILGTLRMRRRHQERFDEGD